MGERPPWLTEAIEDLKKRRRPVWLQEAIDELATVIDDLPREEAERNKAEGGFTEEWMAFARKHEGGRFGYDSWFGRGTSRGPADPPKPPTQMRLDDLIEWVRSNNPAGNDTAAVGAYQIVDQPNAPTLSGLKKKMGLTGDELFSPELQDDMARVLLEQRGLSKFLSGKMDAETFANQVAREWAALPVLKPDSRRGNPIAVGQSYYAGDGTNKAFKGTKNFEIYKNIFVNADLQPEGN